jgi:hypothetical protein
MEVEQKETPIIEVKVGDDVLAWLGSFGMSRFGEAFLKNGFDNMLVCSELEEEDLEFMQVQPRGAKKTILLHSQLLRKNMFEDMAPSPSPMRARFAPPTPKISSLSLDVPHITLKKKEHQEPLFVNQPDKDAKTKEFWTRAKAR